MPATAREFGVTNALDPADNVQGAVKFLKWLQDYWAKRIPDENERLKFILASYNCGAGHVEDAQRLTEKYGGNPQLWEDVSYWLLQKSTQQYSSDDVVKFAATGTKRNWKMRQEFHSPRYTTRWNELFEVK